MVRASRVAHQRAPIAHLRDGVGGAAPGELPRVPGGGQVSFATRAVAHHSLEPARVQNPKRVAALAPERRQPRARLGDGGRALSYPARRVHVQAFQLGQRREKHHARLGDAGGILTILTRRRRPDGSVSVTRHARRSRVDVARRARFGHRRKRARAFLVQNQTNVAVPRRLRRVRLGARERAERDEHSLRRVRVFRVRVLLARDRAERLQRPARLLRRVQKARGNHHALASGVVRRETRLARGGRRRRGGRGARGWARGEETGHHLGLRASRAGKVEVSGPARSVDEATRLCEIRVMDETGTTERGTPRDARWRVDVARTCGERGSFLGTGTSPSASGASPSPASPSRCAMATASLDETVCASKEEVVPGGIIYVVHRSKSAFSLRSRRSAFVSTARRRRAKPKPTISSTARISFGVQVMI